MPEDALQTAPVTAARRLRVPVEVRWADTDQYGHVNNVAFLRFAEEARIRTFGLPDRPVPSRPDGEPPVLAFLGADTFTIVAGQRIEYRRELAHDGRPVVCELWLSRIGSRSIDLDVRVLDADEHEAAVLTVAVVIMDVRTRRPRALTDEESMHLGRFVGPGVRFR